MKSLMKGYGREKMLGYTVLEDKLCITIALRTSNPAKDNL
jgi:hypothetical protein